MPRWRAYLLPGLLVLRYCVGAWGASNQDPSSTASSNGGRHHPEETLIFIFGAIFIGTVVLHLTTLPALAKIPVTVVLFVLGIFWALLVENHVLDTFGMIVRSYEAWVAIDPHLLLFTFLPALLCGDAMTIDTHIAKRTVGQCLILAGPGVIMGSFATAGLIYGVLPYGWDFSTCLTVGSILAATDPVAVVGLLKDLGASPVLTMQIQGESLLNDGTAMVLFRVAYDIVSGEEYGVGRVIAFMLQSTLGASALGVTIGLAFFLWIRSASDKLNHTSMIIQISLTLLCAYWSFIFAEGVCHISGVLSTVAAASVLAHMMWPVIVEQRSMLETWHVIETIGNTMVFFLAGVLTGRSMLKTSFEDYLWTVLMYVIMNVLRFTMFLLLRPLLNLVGQPVTLSDIIVMTWGGLRGMVGLALAILVRQDLAKGRLSEKDGDRILFLVSGIAALTLVINATTSPSLCKALGVTQAPECRKVLLANVAKRAEKHVHSILGELQENKRASKTLLIGFVRESIYKIIDHQMKTPVLNNPLTRPNCLGTSQRSSSLGSVAVGPRHRHSSFIVGLIKGTPGTCSTQDLWKRFEAKRVELLQTGGTIEAFQYGGQLRTMEQILDTTSVDITQLKLVREVFLEALRASYWDQLKQGRFLVGSSEPTILLNSVNLAKDKCGNGLTDWRALEREVVLPSESAAVTVAPLPPKPSRSRSSVTTTKSQSGSKEVWWWRRQLEEWKIRRHFSQQMKAVQIIDAFLDAHRKAQIEIASYFGDNEDVDSAEETWVLIESQIEVFEAAIARSKIAKGVQLKVNTMWRVHLLAEDYRSFVISAHERGILQAKEAETLLHPIEHGMHELTRDRRKLKQALQREMTKTNAGGKSGASTYLTRVDAAQRIQRNFRKRMQAKSMNENVQKVHLRSTIRATIHALRVDSVSDEDEESTASGDCPNAVPERNESKGDKGGSFMSVLPNYVND